MDDFGARSDGTAEAFWELRNFGAGDIIRNRIRQTQVEQANLNLVDVQARVAEEIAAAVRSAEAARRRTEFAQAAVVQALETWRRLREASFGLAGAEHQYDPLQPLIALRDLADARTQYLRTVIEYNRHSFACIGRWGSRRWPRCRNCRRKRLKRRSCRDLIPRSRRKCRRPDRTPALDAVADQRISTAHGHEVIDHVIAAIVIPPGRLLIPGGIGGSAKEFNPARLTRRPPFRPIARQAASRLIEQFGLFPALPAVGERTRL